MNKSKTIQQMNLLRAFRSVFLAISLALYCGNLFAGVEPYENSLKGAIKKGDTLVTKDEKFRNPLFDWNEIVSRKVKNYIVLEMTFDTAISLKKAFSCETLLKIEYFSNPEQVEPIAIENIKLKINYSPDTGSTYKAKDVYAFANGYWVKVTVVKITSKELGDTIPPVLQLSNQMVVERKYKFHPEKSISLNASIELNHNSSPQRGNNIEMQRLENIDPPGQNHFHLGWDHISGAEEYDIEWTVIDWGTDKEQLAVQLLNNVPNLDAQLDELFRNNATRITTDANSYCISMVYNSRYILVRMRQVSYNGLGIRDEAPWDYRQDPGSAYSIWPIFLNWHEKQLNWQYSASFAEEGKKKEVMSYFDGTLRSRQVVTTTINNSDTLAVVQENIYDEFGRAAASILPAVINEKNLHYYRDQNMNEANTASYDFTNLRQSIDNCEFGPERLYDGSGAAKYYSNNNDFASLTNAPSFVKYTPHAEKYPLSVTQYVNDNTGRIRLQGGVGKLFQPGDPDNKVTKYFYSKPEQWELDRLFGNDVGYADHYLKNMVMDPNGQFSISYVNASGKTIATALTGNAPNNLDPLPSKPTAHTEVIPILKPRQFRFDATSLSLKATTTYMASLPGTVTLDYDIQKLIYTYSGSNFQICSNCYYDLTINVTNDCNQPVYSHTQPFTVGSATADCNNTGLHTATISPNFSKVGEYFISFEFKLSNSVIERYTEQYIVDRQAHGDMRTEFNFILDFLISTEFLGCFNECTTCKEALGTREFFTEAIKDKLEVDGVVFSTTDTDLNNWINDLYDDLAANCLARRAECMVSPCTRYERQMLDDVSPGGQYALFDFSNFTALEQEINVLYNHWRTEFPILLPGNVDYDKEAITLDDGTVTSPHDANFTLPMLVQYWKEEWASKFLQYHPEKCKLDFCQTYSSFISWDDQVKELIKKASEIPQIPGSTGLQYDNGNPDWLLAADPFFQTGAPGEAHKNDFSADLEQFSTRIMNLTDPAASVKGLTMVVDFLLYCNDPSGNTSTGDPSNRWNNCTPVPTCRVPDKEWDLYKQYYFQLKEKYYQIVRSDGLCANKCPVGKPYVSGGTCPGTHEFSLTIVARDESLSQQPCPGQRQIRLLSSRGTLRIATTVQLYYPFEYASLGLQATFQFAIGESEKLFCIPENIPLSAILVQSVTCSGSPTSPPSCPFGNGGELHLLSGAIQLDNYRFRWFDTSVGYYRTYTMSPRQGNIIPAQENFCQFGTTTLFDYFDCYSVYLPGSSIPIQYYNVWVSHCLEDSGPPMWKTEEGEKPVNEGLKNQIAKNSLSNKKVVNSTVVVKKQVTAGKQLLSDKLRLNSKRKLATSTTMNDPSNCDFYFVVEQTQTACDGSHTYFNISIPFDLDMCEGQVATGSFYYTYPSQGILPESINIPFGQTTTQICVPNELIVPEQWFYACGSVGPPCQSSCPDIYLNKKSRFPAVDYNINIDVNGMLNENTGLILEQIETNCEAQADIWMDKLAGCLNGVSETTKNELRAKLIEVCVKGGDLEHPFGSSTTPFGQPTTSGYSSFKEVIMNVLGLSQLTMSCNPWLLDVPHPYLPKQQSVEKIISNTSADLCNKLAVIRSQHQIQQPNVTLYQYLATKYGTAMNLTPAQLAMLLKSCDNCHYILEEDLPLPVFLEPGTTGCITNTEYGAAKQALQTELGTNYNPADEKYPEILTNYLNHRWGFSLSYRRYTEYEALIATNSSAILCNQTPYLTIEVDPYSCLKDLMSLAIINGKREYEAYVIEEKRKFRLKYIEICSAAKANARLTAQQQIYHYTLYYYDQAGNLLRTVPPEGVTLLTNEEINRVDDARGFDGSDCTYAGPNANTNKNTALQHLSDALANSNNRSIEMWLYNENASSNQVLAVTPDKQFLYHSCLNGNLLNVDIYTTQQTQPDQFDFVLSNHVTVNVASLQPLHPWTHIVVQGNILASGSLAVYVNGSLMPVVPGAPPADCSWEVGPGNPILLPENLSTVKHLRIYNELLTSLQIAANAAQSCFNIDQSIPLSELVHWARFNTPNPGDPTTIGENSTVETQASPVYPWHSLPTTYLYNSTGQVVKQKSPDGGTSYFWYDKLNRLIASQNEEQKTPYSSGIPNRYSYTKYEPTLGRIIEVGEKTNYTVGLGDPGFLEPDKVEHFSNNGNNSQITQTIYDQSPLPGPGVQTGLSQENLRKRASASYFRYTYTNPVSQATYYSYDLMGNVKTFWQQVEGLGVKRVDYEYDLVSGKVNFVRYQDGQNDQFFYAYKYDSENRLIDAFTGTEANGNALIGSFIPEANRQQDAHYQYYFHGPLARVELGQQKVQGVDYAYTLQGWLKGINGHALNPNTEIGEDGKAGGAHPTVAKDVMAYTLGYFQDPVNQIYDYKPIQVSATAFSMNYTPQPSDVTGRSLYNGNISHTTVAIAHSSFRNGDPVGYTYRYDQLNRLTGMQQHLLTGTTTNWNNVNGDVYRESIAYDGNGNIKTYLRNGATASALQMDNLTYGYNTATEPATGRQYLLNNRLRHVKDAVASTAYTEDIDDQDNDNYEYDKIGNLVKDNAEKITDIQWTVYGKIASFTKDETTSVGDPWPFTYGTVTTISYSYDASGNRVSKTKVVATFSEAAPPPPTTETTYYLRDAQGNVLAVYEQFDNGLPILPVEGGPPPQPALIWKEQHLYGSSRLGMWRPDADITNGPGNINWGVLGKKSYELTNHLGNVLVVISDKLVGAGFDQAEILSANDYYPFGMVMPGRVFSVSVAGYRFGMNGQEKSGEIFQNAYTAEFWEYDSRTARRWNVDPEVKEWESPYACFSNNPIWFKDVNGADTSKGTINVFVAYKNRDKALQMSYDEAVKAAKASKGNLVVVEVGNIKDLLKDLQKITKNGDIKVNTLIIDSHGDYKNAKFQIGSTVVHKGDGKELEKIGTYLNKDGGTIVLLGCHSGGNTINNGESMITTLSCTTHSTVYACRSWTGPIALFGSNVNPSQMNPDRMDGDQQPLAWQYLGQWNKSYNGVTPVLLKAGITLSSTGNVSENYVSPAAPVQRGIKKIKNVWDKVRKSF